MSQPLRSSDIVEQDVETYRRVRARLPLLAAGLSAEDLTAQAMPEASPGKWHLGHVSWFFETMILGRRPDYVAVDERLNRLFNSYYEGLGERVDRAERGLMTRPSLDQVMAYRDEIDRRMEARLAEGLGDGLERYLFELGLHHEQQHQELFLMDMLNLMARSPLDPAAYEAEPRAGAVQGRRGGWGSFEGGLTEIGAGDEGFAFDNERPAHRVWLEPYSLAADLSTNADWIEFIDDDGYRRPEFWLSDGWARVKAEGWAAPLYWRQEAAGWSVMTLAGRRPVDPAAPVRHVSFYEADAFARWSGRRLPTEGEWEHAARSDPAAFSNLSGEVWQWTGSAYAPYPGFCPTEGTAAEYNGKFMANQMVLRGGAFATPEGHARPSYRNFYYPHQRWMFAGVRLAADGALIEETGAHDAFRQDMIDGLSRRVKALPPKWFYDAEGSRLFEEITRLPEYYPTRQEAALLRRVAPKWAGRFGPDAVLVELGSGASEKTRIVLDAARDLAAYVPIDISASALNEAAERICADYPGLKVLPVVGDFEHLSPPPREAGQGRRIGFFPGSTIGNLMPEAAIALLRSAREVLGEGSLFILGVDLVKSPEVLVAAYDDAQGVTAAFNRNLLVRANRDLGMDFEPEAFDHVALWNPEHSRMEMHLKATRPMTVRLGKLAFRFNAGETVHTESSRKFDEASVKVLAQAAGWGLEAFEVGPDPAVGLALLVA
ncbi:dimethylhistidine N-methyltransferase [Brevundimonas bullata]|uniref:Dimethylhistidine N-methyltransferase n=1 Tax=Brevundimonas bullata TaxID=13160 RepID=A0A7W7IP37_9CAUL|nr:ergothioneine biosynthesis protein EgtB [Brevundimonas bullata]MBB4797921.1 dimethylhistidine N-methyltransferase [Brevundimonas bullata]MBB6382880.1 dimethylhistidine N-methyltransferase [Brevundimonas bullata]